MGKSPAKWIKTLLLGKKSSKSNLSRGKEKLVTVSMDPPTISAPILVDNTRNMVHSEMKGTPAQLPNNGANIPSLQAVGKDNAISNFGKPEDPDRIRLDRAAAKAQASFRGYLARRAFRTLKGIIKLQALIRGHLVRRQAVATFCCTWGIVKFQALARGREVRCSDIGTEVQEKHQRLPQGSKSKNPFGVTAFSQVKNLTNNVFVQKLLASSHAVLPLCLQYGPEEPNSSWQWLQRWTSSRFWESPSQVLIRSPALKTQTKGVENGLGKIKPSVWKLSNAKIENGSYSTLEHGKSKCCARTVSGNSATNTILEHPQNELEKVKRTLRKLSGSAKEISKKYEVVNDKTKQSLKITSTSDAPDVLEEEPAEKMMRDVSATLSTLLNHETDMRLSAEDTSLDEPNVCPAVDLAPAENNGKIDNMLVTEELSSKDEHISDESLEKAKERRASFPAKAGNLENGLNNMRKVPSYMSPTESVKARLRSQGSPRFASEVVDKNGLNRRYSLPSSTNSNLSYLSPSGQTPAQVAGKGAIRGNKPLSSTRDASVKPLLNMFYAFLYHYIIVPTLYLSTYLVKHAHRLVISIHFERSI